MAVDQWFYFGCHREAGHYLWREGMQQHWRREGRDLSRFDGMLAPQDSTDPYIAVVSRLEGWGVTALAFWDYSVDKRGGCNSIVFAPSLTIAPDDLLTEAQARFPQVFGRLPSAVRLKTAPGVPAAGPATVDPVSKQLFKLAAHHCEQAVYDDKRVEQGWTFSKDGLLAFMRSAREFACACGAVERQGWTHRPEYCWPDDEHAPGVPATDEAQRLRELLRRTQTYVCGNRDLMGASELCGEIAEALAATKRLRTPGVKVHPNCGACPGDGTVCKTNCRLAEDSPTLLGDDTIGALWRDLSQRGHAADYNDFWNIVKAVERAITHGVKEVPRG